MNLSVLRRIEMNVSLRRQAINLYERVNGRHILARLAELNRIQWLSREELLAYQQDKLQRLLKSAYTFVPYYRRLFDQVGFRPDDILADPAAFQKIPTSSKSIVHDHFDELITTDPGRQGQLAQNSTGGSTGSPLVFIQDYNFRDYVMAGVHWHMQWPGWEFGESHAYLWGADYEVITQKTIRARALDWSLNRVVCNAFTLSEESMMAFTRKIRRTHPKVLSGYASALERFAKFVQAHHMDDIKFTGVISNSEVLYPRQRELFERTFDCVVLNRYATRELGGIACECPEHMGLHIGVGEVYVEILRDGVPVPVGEEGDVVVTNLNNYGMPFIRYHVGDVAQLSDKVCRCGRGLPVMEVVHGRSSDMLRTKDGRVVHPAFFTHTFFDMREVKQFQITQKSYDHIIVSLVEQGKLSPEQLAFLEQHIKGTFGSEVKVEIELLDAIPLKPSGKYRFIICEVE
jgi:phenylacetate-CoA ligase